jgi:hypothetical protein
VAVKGFVVLYCFANFFQNFGPNTTTFVIPGEVFPTRYRSTAHGISAASGKLGAIVAQVGFARMVNIGGTNVFVKHMWVFFLFFRLQYYLISCSLPALRYSLSSGSLVSFPRFFYPRRSSRLWKSCPMRTKKALFMVLQDVLMKNWLFRRPQGDKIYM